MYSSMTRLFGTNFCRTCEFSTDNQLIRGFRGAPSPCPGHLPFPLPFPLPWPPALAARSASVLIRINEFLFCIRTISPVAKDTKLPTLCKQYEQAEYLS